MEKLSYLFNIRFLMIFVLAIVFFWYKGNTNIDPDFGWHLKLGEVILNSGIPRADPFSYTMPSYKFVDYEWLTNIAFFKIYELIGGIGLAGIFAFIGVFAVFLQILFLKKKFIEVSIMLILVSLLPFITGIRPQLISWLFFSFLSLLILNDNYWNKYKILVPVVFLLWANLHGGFVLGIGVLGLFVILELIQDYFINNLVLGSRLSVIRSKFTSDQSVGLRQTDKQKTGKPDSDNRKLKTENSKYNLLILFFSLLATLLNPYGFDLWREVWLIISDSQMRSSIHEWTPAFFSPNIALWTYLSFSLVLIYKYKKNLNLTELVIYIFLLIAGIFSVRNMPFLLIFSLPLTIKAINIFYEEARKIEYGEKRFKKAYKFFFYVILLISIFQIYVTFDERNSITENSFYPVDAVEYLKNVETQDFVSLQKGEIFSYYGWGGYLVWKYPGRKVFIDGRMPIWRQKIDDNKESSYAFGEYASFLQGDEQTLSIIKKYNIKTVLLQNAEHLKLEQRLKKNNWKLVYKDKIAVIYKKYQK